MTAKARGTLFYWDTDSDDQYRVVSCLLELDPSGFERGVVEGEPCLEDAFLTQDTGDLKLTTVKGTALFTANDSTTENALETLIKADTSLKAAVKLNYPTPVYVYMVGKLVMLKQRSLTRDKKYARDFEFLPTQYTTYSATAPTLEV
jgi:hypothetical protein